MVRNDHRATLRWQHFGKAQQRHHVAGQRRAQVEIIQAVGTATLLRAYFQNDIVLIGLGLIFADLALTKSVVQSLVQIGRGKTKPRCLLPVQFQPDDIGVPLQVVGQIGEHRVLPQLGGQLIGPAGQLVTVERL